MLYGISDNNAVKRSSQSVHSIIPFQCNVGFYYVNILLAAAISNFLEKHLALPRKLSIVINGGEHISSTVN